jgi:hypothetical protein
MYLNKTSSNIELILKDLNKKDLDISGEMNSLAIDIFLVIPDPAPGSMFCNKDPRSCP